MEKHRIILFTTGRGPIECGLAVNGIQNKFRKFLESENLTYKIIEQKLGPMHRTMESIVFKIDATENFRLDTWIGTLQWICKSPIRKFSKRKNWFIKSYEITPTAAQRLDMRDITIQAYRASGPGGQHRNKVETAIRIIHKSSGIIVTASDSKSKGQNKKKALDKLRIRLKEEEDKKLQDFDFERWNATLEIERGNPIKVFHGTKFIEL